MPMQMLLMRSMLSDSSQHATSEDAEMRLAHMKVSCSAKIPMTGKTPAGMAAQASHAGANDQKVVKCNGSNGLMLGECPQVWLYKPVALEEQARQLLQAGQFDQALQLANTCSLAGAPWAETAFAEAGFLLLQGMLSYKSIKVLLGQRCFARSVMLLHDCWSRVPVCKHSNLCTA